MKRTYRGYEYTINIKDMEAVIYGKINRNSTYTTGGVKGESSLVQIVKNTIDRVIRTRKDF